MRQIETIATGKNFSAVSVGKMNEIIEHVLPMGPEVTIQGKVFAGQAVGATRTGQRFPAHPQDARGTVYHPQRRGTVPGGRRDLPRQRGHHCPRGSRRQACAEEHRHREHDDALHPVQGQRLHRG